MQKQIISLCLFLLLSASSAQAGFWFELGGGSLHGDYKFNPTLSDGGGGANADGTFNGANYWLQTGWRFNNLLLGVEGMGLNGTLKTKVEGATTTKGNMNLMGVMIGALAGNFKFWYSYYPTGAGTATPDFEGADEDKLTAGTGMKIGLGYRFMHHFAVNVEYLLVGEYKIKDDSLTYDENQKIKTTGTMVSVSFPFMW